MTTEEALDWIANLFEEPRENISEDTSRSAIPAWDSLGVLMLMAELDEKFDIQLGSDQSSELQSVHDLLQLLRTNGHLS